MKANKNFEKILDYGKRIGLGADTSVYLREGMLAYLTEIGYGRKPTGLDYIEKTLPPDTTRVRLAGWELAQGTDLPAALAALEPPYPAYKALIKHYERLTRENKPDSAAWVAESLNAYRWMHRQAQGSARMVLINTRGAYLKGLDSLGNEQIRMHVIVGKSGTATPVMDTYATSVIINPYWNIPSSIAVGEMLPRIQENIYYLQRNGIEVLDNKGKVVSEFDIDWNNISEENFPYRFRQDTGEGNSLGFLKITLLNPLAIYLHDTNVRTLFDQEKRWRSHGCVRLQQPSQLANYLAGKDIIADDFVQQSLSTPETERKPKTFKLDQKIPAFLYYLPADVDKNGALVYYPDVYDLDKSAD